MSDIHVCRYMHTLVPYTDAHTTGRSLLLWHQGSCTHSRYFISTLSEPANAAGGMRRDGLQTFIQGHLPHAVHSSRLSQPLTRGRPRLGENPVDDNGLPGIVQASLPMYHPSC